MPDYPLSYADGLRLALEHFSKPDAVFGFDASGGGCVYRGEDDPQSPVRCGIGCLIPDWRYSVNFESKGVGSLLSNSFREAIVPNKLDDILDPSEEQRWSTLQSQHDSAATSCSDSNAEGWVETQEAMGDFLGWLRAEITRLGGEL